MPFVVLNKMKTNCVLFIVKKKIRNAMHQNGKCVIKISIFNTAKVNEIKVKSQNKRQTLSNFAFTNSG